MQPTHQTIRLAPGRHRSPHIGACVMELASMLAGERFSDRPATASPVIAAFLRTYNDGIDDERRQDLYPLASLIVGTAGGRAVERERMSRCLEFARSLGGGSPSGRDWRRHSRGEWIVGRAGGAPPRPVRRGSFASAGVRP